MLRDFLLKHAKNLILDSYSFKQEFLAIMTQYMILYGPAGMVIGLCRFIDGDYDKDFSHPR